MLSLALALALSLPSQCPGGVCPPQVRYIPQNIVTRQSAPVYGYQYQAAPVYAVQSSAPCRPVRKGLFGRLFGGCR